MLGEATYEAVRADADARPIEALELKGKAAPVTAYVLSALR